jgi:hypothetical protein
MLAAASGVEKVAPYPFFDHSSGEFAKYVFHGRREYPCAWLGAREHRPVDENMVYAEALQLKGGRRARRAGADYHDLVAIHALQIPLAV